MIPIASIPPSLMLLTEPKTPKRNIKQKEKEAAVDSLLSAFQT